MTNVHDPDLTTIHNGITNFRSSLANRLARVPQESEEQSARDMGAHQMLLAFNNDIERLKTMESLLYAARLEIEEHVIVLRERFSAVKTLPHEILAYVFWLGLGHDPLEDSNLLGSVTQVCKDWRAIAIGETKLWRRIYGEWPSKQRAMYLARSASTPIEVFIWSIWDGPLVEDSDTDSDTDSDEDVAFDLREDLLAESSRWRSLSLMNCAPAFTSRFIERISQLNTLDRLQALHISGRVFSPSTSFNFKASLPSLRSLRIWGPCLSGIEVVGQNLIDLAVDPPLYTPQAWAVILASCTSLGSLAISSDYRRPQQDPEGLPDPLLLYNLPWLHTLSLGSDSDRTDVETLRLMLACIRAPKLANIKIMARGTLSSALDVAASISGFLSRTPTIIDLTLIGNDEVLSGVLGELAIPSGSNTSDINSVSLVLPRLRRLAVVIPERSRGSIHPLLGCHLEDLLGLRTTLLASVGVKALDRLKIIGHPLSIITKSLVEDQVDILEVT